MKARHVIAIASIVSISVSILLTPSIEFRKKDTRPIEELITIERSHPLETWLSALEWCESRGVASAINEVDRDGTSSFYSFQYKPSTFKDFGEAYGILAKGLPSKTLSDLLKDTTMQRDITRIMSQDPHVELAGQFPECLRKIGRPPKTESRYLYPEKDTLEKGHASGQ